MDKNYAGMLKKLVVLHVISKKWFWDVLKRKKVFEILWIKKRNKFIQVGGRPLRDE